MHVCSKFRTPGFPMDLVRQTPGNFAKQHFFFLSLPFYLDSSFISLPFPLFSFHSLFVFFHFPLISLAVPFKFLSFCGDSRQDFVAVLALHWFPNFFLSFFLTMKAGAERGERSEARKAPHLRHKHKYQYEATYELHNKSERQTSQAKRGSGGAPPLAQT